MDVKPSSKRPAHPRSFKTNEQSAIVAVAPPAPAESDERSGNGFAKLTELLGKDRLRAIDAIRAGFPASVLKDTGAYFEIPVNRIRALVRLPETTAHELVKRGACLDAATSERIWRLADLMSMANDVFEDEEAAKTWLRSPNRTFSNAAPMEYLDTEPGAIQVRQVLNAIATGGVA